jgi:hypothetical protein
MSGGGQTIQENSTPRSGIVGTFEETGASETNLTTYTKEQEARTLTRDISEEKPNTDPLEAVALAIAGVLGISVLSPYLVKKLKASVPEGNGLWIPKKNRKKY